MDYAASLLAGEMAAVFHEMPKSSGRVDSSPTGLQSFLSMDDMGISSGMSSSGSGSDREEEERRKSARNGARAVGSSSHVVTRSEVREFAPLAAATPNGEKRVKNDLIKKELGVELEFPTYREGLAAIARGDVRPFKHLNG